MAPHPRLNGVTRGLRRHAMAVRAKVESERSNRVRFVILDADLSDTNVNALAQAIVSALRPEVAAPPLKRLAPATPTSGRLTVAATEPSNGHSGHADQDDETINTAAAEVTEDDDAPG